MANRLDARIMLDESGETVRFGTWSAQLRRPTSLGVVIEGLSGPSAAPPDYLTEVLFAREHRDAFLQLVDREGLVICKNVFSSHPSYRAVRGRSSRGRLSQGEYYHHDGCAGPTKPRVVEIRCPHQEVARQIATAVAPFPDSVIAMLRALPPKLAKTSELAPHVERMAIAPAVPRVAWDTVQGLVTRTVRHHLAPEQAREYFREVDNLAGAYRLPWEMGESRLIANNNEIRTMQHRRAYLHAHMGGQANGHLVKRWPAEEL